MAVRCSPIQRQRCQPTAERSGQGSAAATDRMPTRSPARSGCCATTAATATPVSKRPPWSRGGREPSATPKASNRPAHPGTRSPFQAGVAGCEKCLTFIGDYIGLDYGRDGKVNMAWTDMREFRTIEGVSGYAQHIAY